MSADKLITIFGILAKLEASYNAGGSLLAASDGHMLAELPEFTPEWANDGARSAPPGSLGYLRRAAPSGRTATVPLKFEMKGAGAAYSSSVVPMAHVFFRAAGLDATLTSTAGSEKWVYAPTPGPTGFASLVAELYARGEKYTFTGAYCDLEFGAEGPAIPVATFTARGLLSDPTDVAVPAITYPLAAIVPPKAVGAGLLALAGVSDLVVKSWKVRLGWEIVPRVDMNTAAGHAGFARARRTPQLEVTFETPAKATLDPEALWAAGDEIAAGLVVGGEQYNRFSVDAFNAQIMAPPAPSAEGSVALTTLQLQLNPSTALGNNEIAITFD